MKTTIMGIEIEAALTQKKDGHVHGSKARHHVVTLKKDGKTVKFDFWASINDPEVTTDSDMLRAVSCFVSDAMTADQTFESFCDEFAYSDPPQALKVFKGCKSAASKLKKLNVDVNELWNMLEAS